MKIGNEIMEKLIIEMKNVRVEVEMEVKKCVGFSVVAGIVWKRMRWMKVS